MMLNFPCKDNAIDIINKLYDLGHIVIIATARAKDWHKEPERITNEWLKKVGLKYSRLYIGRVDKEKICEEVDADINKGKGQSFLMNSDYNKLLKEGENVIRVESFLDFENILEEKRWI